MLIIPAIDLKSAKVVRLYQGRFDRQKVYSNDPVKAARHWAKQGAKLLHIVDLDGAAGGKPKNIEALKNILGQVCLPVEFGGGVRNIQTIRELLDLGVERVVLGTAAATDKVFLRKAWKKFGPKIIVSIDAKAGKVATQGWNKTSSRTALELAGELKALGFKQVIYTDISKDGTLAGPNFAGIKALFRQTGLDIIASGGVSSLKDLERLAKMKKQGVCAAIVGKALYEGKFTLAEALKSVQ